MAIIIIVIIAFHVLMLLLALGVATQLIPVSLVSNFLGYVHNTIGITTPPMEKVKTIALIWIGATIVIVDGCLFLLVAITRLSSSG
jgi:energy-converting hydrogenase Eha subunit C